MRQIMQFSILLIMIFSVSVIWAQPPGGDGGRIPNVEVEVPNVEVPDIDEIELDVQADIDIDVQSQALLATVSAVDVEAVQDREFDQDTFRAMMDDYDVPDDWSQIDLTGQMPSLDDIQAMSDELPIDIDNLDIGLESSATATSAIVGYASSMLNLNVTPLYAGEYGDSEIDSSEAAQTTISAIYDELDEDMQALLTQADDLSGVAYWALLEDGVALVYTGDCELDECTIEQQAVQVEITNGSAGVYALYSDTIPSSTNEAKALVQSTYPYLATIELSETESDYGTAFFAFDINMDSQQVTAYYAGVYDTGAGKSVVYALSGIGDAYINVLLGG